MADFQKEKKVIQGEETKDMTYSSEKKFPDGKTAEMEFQRAVNKLFDVNAWTELPGITSTFQLYTSQGAEKNTPQPQVNDFIKILLPGPFPENWVIVTDVRKDKNFAEFVVSPSFDPSTKGDEREEVKHFFIKEATSTFRVEHKDKSIIAYEIGKNEGINNEGKEAADRELINTLVAEGGWAAFQKFQWKKLTDYLVHEIEIN
jgi:hypothetical protein